MISKIKIRHFPKMHFLQRSSLWPANKPSCYLWNHNTQKSSLVKT